MEKILSGGGAALSVQSGGSGTKKMLKERYVPYRNSHVGRGPISPGPPKKSNSNTGSKYVNSKKIIQVPSLVAESSKRPELQLPKQSRT